MYLLKKSLTFSNAIALLALFIALGGSVYAASNKISGTQIKPKTLPGNRLKAGAVGAAQIKKGAIGAAQLKAGAVGAKQIQSGSITGAQIKSGSLGATQINQGSLTGVSAANIHAVQYVATTVTLVGGAPLGTAATATCPSGLKVIAGGASLSNKEFGLVLESTPTTDRNGWTANGELGANRPTVTMTVTAICTAIAAPAG